MKFNALGADAFSIARRPVSRPGLMMSIVKRWVP
jgi:hypothetical protein